MVAALPVTEENRLVTHAPMSNVSSNDQTDATISSPASEHGDSGEFAEDATVLSTVGTKRRREDEETIIERAEARIVSRQTSGSSWRDKCWLSAEMKESTALFDWAVTRWAEFDELAYANVAKLTTDRFAARRQITDELAALGKEVVEQMRKRVRDTLK